MNTIKTAYKGGLLSFKLTKLLTKRICVYIIYATEVNNNSAKQLL